MSKCKIKGLSTDSECTVGEELAVEAAIRNTVTVQNNRNKKGSGGKFVNTLTGFVYTTPVNYEISCSINVTLKQVNDIVLVENGTTEESVAKITRLNEESMTCTVKSL